MGKLKRVCAMLIAMVLVLADGSFAQIAKAATGTDSTDTYANSSTLKVHFKHTKWNNSTFYIYAYGDGDKAVTSAWPGDTLKADPSQGDGWYVYENSSVTSANVMFNTGNGSANRDPGDGQPGYKKSGEVWYLDGEWYDYNPEKDLGKVVVNYVDVDGNVIKEQLVMKGEDGGSYTVEKPSIDGYIYKSVSGELTGKYNSSAEATVTLVYDFANNGIVHIESISKANGSAITLNSSTTIDVEATSSTDGIYYKFIVTDPNGKQVDDILKYTKKDSYTFVPSVKGDYTIEIYAQAHNMDNTTVSRKMTYKAQEGQIVEELEASLSVDKTTVDYDGTVNMTATATGGSGNYTYKFEVADDISLSNATTIQAASSKASASWKANKSGKKYIVVTVTDREGKTATASKMVTVGDKVVEEELSVSLSGIKSSYNVGDKLTATATAAGGSGNYRYKFEIYDSKLSESVTISESSKASASWTVNTTDVGTAGYVIVTVTDSEGNEESASKSFKIEVEEELAVSLKLSSSSISPKETVTMTATATGGSGKGYKYTYKVGNKALTSVITLKSDTTASKYTWKSSAAGTRKMVVVVEDSEGNTASATQLLTIKKASNLVATIKLSSTTIAPKEAVTITASAAGGSGSGYKYTYKVANTAFTTFVTLSTGTSKTATWKSSTAGMRYLVVTVTDSQGNSATAKQLLTIQKDSDLGVSLKLNNSTVTAKGTVTMTATATGGSGSYTYSYKVANKSLTSIVDLVTTDSKTYTWKTSAAGNRMLIVTVTDSKGNTATAQQALTIK